MQSIEYNKENHPILNQTHDNLAELQEKDKKIIMCKVLAHMRIKGNKEAAKEALDMPGVITTRLSYTDYYLAIRRSRNSKWKREWENSSSKLHYIKLSIEKRKSAHNSLVKLSRICIGHTRTTLGYLMTRSNQHVQMQHVVTRH